MTIPVWVEQQNGTFTASVLGSPLLRASGGSREVALAALRSTLFDPKQGELVMLDIPAGVTALAGKYSDDPGWRETWDDSVAEAYRYRDELKAQEFPE